MLSPRSQQQYLPAIWAQAYGCERNEKEIPVRLIAPLLPSFKPAISSSTLKTSVAITCDDQDQNILTDFDNSDHDRQ